jgi:hypothetical protein
MIECPAEETWKGRFKGGFYGGEERDVRLLLGRLSPFH